MWYCGVESLQQFSVIMPWDLWSVQDNAPVNSEEGKSYGERVKLEMDEDKLRSFLQHSTRTGLSLNSRCMLLWINVASFCVSLLTRDREMLSGILSNTVPMEGYCVSQLRHIWMFMRNNMQLTDEELSYLVMMCMRRYLQVCGNIWLMKCKYLFHVLLKYHRLGLHSQTKWVGPLQVQKGLQSMSSVGTVMSLCLALRNLEQRYAYVHRCVAQE